MSDFEWILHSRLAEAMVGNSVQTQQSEQLFSVTSIPAYRRKVLLLQNLTR